MTDWDPEAFTRGLIEDMRAHNGAITSGPMAGRPLLLLTTKGAKSGEERSAIVTYTRDGDKYVVAATKSGAPTNPAWYHNLRADPIVTVEAEGRASKARATVVDDAERQRLWDRHVEARPEFADYPEKSGRVIPVITLERLD
ncbi:MAG TPA: nitroreductase/quinone reductase family protein [Candidatus Limnocylindrales bacterium]|nr:nitroreductase/quinone reductase family protein [Candidatus Limnocylindrales bacterium]